MLVGGVATAAAVRTFPFRVFSFPKEIVVADPQSIFLPIGSGAHTVDELRMLTGMPYWAENFTGTYMGISRSRPDLYSMKSIPNVSDLSPAARFDPSR